MVASDRLGKLGRNESRKGGAAARKTRLGGLRDRTFDDTRRGANPELGEGLCPQREFAARGSALAPRPAIGNSAAVLSRS